MAQTLIPGEVISLTAQAADRLLKADSGDGALLYLHLLRHGTVDGLGWTAPRLQSALTVLQQLEMAPKLATAPPPIPQVVLPVDEPVPSYTMEEIAQALGEETTSFTSVADEVERQLGKKLNATDLKMLYTLYDHLQLPPEVILLLTTHCVEEHQRKFGQGRRPFVSVIKKEGFYWARRGIETVERAEEFLKERTLLRSRESSILQTMDIAPRPLVTQEQSYIAEWVSWGFPDEVIRLGFEKTLLKKGSLDWRYLNGILRGWHDKGLHSLDAIQKGDSGSAPRGQIGFQPAPKQGGQWEEKRRGEMERMRRLAEQMRREES